MNSNLFTNGTKSWQNLNVESVNASTLTAEEFKFSDYESRYARIGKTLIGFAANTPQNIVDYDIVQNGTLPGFDPVSGIYTAPEEGLYYFQYRMNLLSGPPSEWSFRVLDPDSANQYSAEALVLSGVDTDYDGGTYTSGHITELTQGQKMILNYTCSGVVTNVFAYFKVIRLF